MIECPNLIFSEWRRWSSRPRPSQSLDVPPEFGILGLYLLAGLDETNSSPSSNNADIYLQSEVVYIGMSTHVEQRLERTHSGVAQYRKHFNDSRCNNLWFSTWHSDVTNWSLRTREKESIIAYTTVALYERALLLEYAKKYGRLPILNKQ